MESPTFFWMLIWSHSHMWIVDDFSQTGPWCLSNSSPRKVRSPSPVSTLWTPARRECPRHLSITLVGLQDSDLEMDKKNKTGTRVESFSFRTLVWSRVGKKRVCESQCGLTHTKMSMTILPHWACPKGARKTVPILVTRPFGKEKNSTHV